MDWYQFLILNNIDVTETTESAIWKKKLIYKLNHNLWYVRFSYVFKLILDVCNLEIDDRIKKIITKLLFVFAISIYINKELCARDEETLLTETDLNISSRKHFNVRWRLFEPTTKFARELCTRLFNLLLKQRRHKLNIKLFQTDQIPMRLISRI